MRSSSAPSLPPSPPFLPPSVSALQCAFCDWLRRRTFPPPHLCAHVLSRARGPLAAHLVPRALQAQLRVRQGCAAGLARPQRRALLHTRPRHRAACRRRAVLWSTWAPKSKLQPLLPGELRARCALAATAVLPVLTGLVV